MEDKTLDQAMEDFTRKLQIYKKQWEQESDRINPSGMGYGYGRTSTMEYVLEELNKINNY